jgi:hypothetical protein
LGDCGSGGGCDDSARKKRSTNAIEAHESKSLMCVMTRLIPAHCVQNLLRRSETKSSLYIKYLMLHLVPYRER